MMHTPSRVVFQIGLAACLTLGILAATGFTGEVEDVLGVDLLTGTDLLDEEKPAAAKGEPDVLLELVAETVEAAPVVAEETPEEPVAAVEPEPEVELEVVAETVEAAPVVAEETPEEPVAAVEPEPEVELEVVAETVEAAPVVAEVTPEEPVASVEPEPGVPSQVFGGVHEIGPLLDALYRKDEELRSARKEIARLRDMLNQADVRDRQDEVAVLYNLGCVYRAGGYDEKAEKAFLRALELNEADAALHYNLGILYDDSLGRKDKARRHYERFLELAPNDKDAPRVVEWLQSIMP